MFTVTADAYHHYNRREDLAVKSIATQVGAVGFFRKPFDDEQFLAAVYHALGTVAGHETKVL